MGRYERYLLTIDLCVYQRLTQRVHFAQCRAKIKNNVMSYTPYCPQCVALKRRAWLLQKQRIGGLQHYAHKSSNPNPSYGSRVSSYKSPNPNPPYEFRTRSYGSPNPNPYSTHKQHQRPPYHKSRKQGGAGPGEKCNWSFACPTGYTCEGGVCVARTTCGFLRVCPNNKNCWNGVCR